MAIEKSLYEAPKGLDEGTEIDVLELDLDLPEPVEFEDGSIEVTLIEEDKDISEIEFGDNLAEYMDETVLEALSSELMADIDSDIESRKEWAETFVKGLELLGFKYEERTQPWEGACGAHSPLLAEAAIRFQAETMSETFPAAGPVKTKILGEETKEKMEAAERVRTDMNYQLTDKMVEYRSEHERMLYALGLSGSAFKKIYYDSTLGRQAANYVPAEDVIVPYGASNIETAERVTHVMRKTQNEVLKLQANGFYRDTELGEPVPFHTDVEEKKAEEDGFELTEDSRFALFETHADLVIEDSGDSEDGIAVPYVVTIERGTSKVLSIRRNWQDGDKLKIKRQHFVHYVYVPGFGFYGLGLIHIIGGYARAGTSIIRQLVDAGTLSNLPGGLKARGMRIKGDDTPLEPGEFKDVDVPSGAIRDNIMMMPYKEPSATLFQLLNQITTEGRRLGAVSDMNMSDMSANAPVGTTLAILERVLKPMAAVQSRVHFAMKLEFKLLKRMISEYAPVDYEYQPERGEMSAKQSDYSMVDVIPVSDPNNSTMAQRVVQYQTVLQMASQSPEIYDLPQLHRQMIEVLGIKNAEKLVPTEEDSKPRDPVSENMDALVGTPMKAFQYQDHQAHLMSHTSFMQDPMMMQMIGQNPQAQAIMAALHAHMAEHLAFSYRNKIEEKLGVTLPNPGEELPEGIEVELSKLQAQAGQQLSQQNQQQQAQQQAQEQQQDPMVQNQQAELQIKQQEEARKTQTAQSDTQLKQAEQQRKTVKDQIDARIKAKELQLDEQELKMQAEKDNVTFAANRRRDTNSVDLELAKLLDSSRKDRGNK
jgi:hypothetical protein